MPDARPPFAGFGNGFFVVFADLEEHNGPGWWQANKARYGAEIGDPMQALAARLEDRYGSVKVFRPFRDVRFSKDKRPLQEHASLAASPLGPALYLQVSADGAYLAGGYWRSDREVLDAFRALVDRPPAAAGLRRHLDSLSRDGYELAEPTLERAPKGYRVDHPQIDLLRRTSLTVGRHVPAGPWMTGGECLEMVVEGWEVVQRWNRWLVEHVPAPAQPTVP